MALPTSRDQTFGWQSIVPSAFLNTVQDALIAVNAALVAGLAAGTAALVAGLAAANASIAAANASIAGAVADVGTINTYLGFHKRTLLASSGIAVGDPDTYSTSIEGHVWSNTIGGGAWDIPLDVRYGDKISLLLSVKQDVAEAGAIRARLCHSAADDLLTEVAPATTGETLAHTEVQLINLVSGQHTIIEGHHYWVRVERVGTSMVRRYIHLQVISQPV
jgi:hypothetical protein